MRDKLPVHGARGFTLAEVMVVMPLVALLIFGSFNLFLMSLRLGSKASAQMMATQDSANAIQQIVEIGREAYTISLLGSGPLPAAVQNAGYSSSQQFSTTLNGQTIYTGIYVTLPAMLQPSNLTGYAGMGLSYITVKNNQGVSVPAAQTAPMPNPPYTLTPTAGEVGTQSQLLIYRADKDGTPNPNGGGYLWEQPLPAGTNSPGVALCRTVAAGAPNSVQFVQPQSTNQIEVKIVSGVYSAVNGVQTSEEGNGTFTSQLDGSCILMRDHNAQGTSSGTTSIYNPFGSH